MDFSGIDNILGAPALPETSVEVTAIRPLVGKDLKSLKASGREIQKNPPIKELRARHHNLARLLATGTKPGRAGIIAGFSGSYVSILQSDPTFKNLVKHYEEKEEGLYVKTREKLAETAREAVDELASRLEDEPEKFSVGQLLEITKTFADRSGNGPTTTTQVNVTNYADQLQAARLRALEADKIEATTLIDITPEKGITDA